MRTARAAAWRWFFSVFKHAPESPRQAPLVVILAVAYAYTRLAEALLLLLRRFHNSGPGSEFALAPSQGVGIYYPDCGEPQYLCNFDYMMNVTVDILIYTIIDPRA